jgi:hypothetical protein
MRVARSLAIISALAALAAGCSSSGPSYGEAAAELQKDVQRLETNDVFKNPLKKLRFSQRADKDIPCGEEKFQRVLRATADHERKNPDLDGHLDLAEELMENTLVRGLGYKVEFDFSQYDAEDGRFIYAVKEGLGIKAFVYVSPEAPTWRIHAMTDCLPR